MSLHPRPEEAQDAGQIRKAQIQAARSYRDHVRQTQGLEEGCDPLRPMTKGVSPNRCPLSPRHLLPINPDPKYKVFLGNCSHTRLGISTFSRKAVGSGPQASPFVTRSCATRRLSTPRKSDSGTMFGPSDGARSGSS